jgi:hypothetical protein
VSRVAFSVAALVGFCVGVGGATLFWKRQTAVAGAAPPPAVRGAPSPPRFQAERAGGCLDEVRMRQMLEQALDRRLAGLLEPGALAPDPAPSAPRPETTAPEAQAAADELQRRLQAALGSGVWTDQDREAARPLVAKLAFATRERLLQQIVQAVNAGQLRMGSPEPPF